MMITFVDKGDVKVGRGHDNSSLHSFISHIHLGYLTCARPRTQDTAVTRNDLCPQGNQKGENPEH